MPTSRNGSATSWRSAIVARTAYSSSTTMNTSSSESSSSSAADWVPSKSVPTIDGTLTAVTPMTVIAMTTSRAAIPT